MDASSNHWKSRVEKSDAEKFSVAGKMVEKIRNAVPTINIPGVDDNEKKTPQAKRFKLKEGKVVLFNRFNFVRRVKRSEYVRLG